MNSNTKPSKFFSTTMQSLPVEEELGLLIRDDSPIGSFK